ncbi:hypothetical protein J8273_8279 [Carpediemonas membranifera]|uniref:FG-GAP repeat-containing protein n=1 Tax=Carpediemonas membranifera TaxID=201153 RepID=A0A8J6B0D7_9EUKA|nr:hypothetical protein J8273_8279 [Carpediemonas membranifera]|eukprot:KAG9390239.1 hypothetical protein J8273_8279 [Carpediemonas membranifera]
MPVTRCTSLYVALFFCYLSVCLQLAFGANWNEVAKISASDSASYSMYGFAVGADATTVVVGAYQNNKMGQDAGSAYVITQNKAMNWTEAAELFGSDTGSESMFAYAVAVDGDTIVVGAPNQDGVGAVYEFVRGSDGTWPSKETAKLPSPDVTAGDYFGNSLAIKGDTMVVGSPRVAGDDGRVYVYTRAGGVWSLKTTLLPPDGCDGFFGSAVAFDGKTIVAGAHDDYNAGMVVVFVTGDSGATWSRQAVIHAPSGHSNDFFGGAVAVDGDHLVVGASHHSGDRSLSGGAYAFIRSGSSWALKQTLEPDTVADGQMLGTSVWLSGGMALVGMPGYSNNQGAAVAFQLVSGTWTRTATITAPGGDVGDLFAFSLAAVPDASVAFVGAYGVGHESGVLGIFSAPTSHPSGGGSGLPFTALVVIGVVVFVVVLLLVVLLMVVAVGLALALIGTTNLVHRRAEPRRGYESMESLV